MDDIKKHPRIFRDDAQAQLRRAGDRLDPEKSNRVAEAENPLEKVLPGGFHAGDRMRLVKPEKGRPIVGGPERKLEIDAAARF
jgi:hypothetical protein